MNNEPINITLTKEEIERINIASQKYEPVLITRGEFTTIVFPERPDHISIKQHHKHIDKLVKSLSIKGFKLHKSQIYY